MKVKLSPRQQKEIETLEKGYSLLTQKAMSGSNKEFFKLISKANNKLQKIYTIRKKAELKEKYGREYGYSDEEVKIIL